MWGLRVAFAVFCGILFCAGLVAATALADGGTTPGTTSTATANTTTGAGTTTTTTTASGTQARCSQTVINAGETCLLQIRAITDTKIVCTPKTITTCRRGVKGVPVVVSRRRHVFKRVRTGKGGYTPKLALPTGHYTVRIGPSRVGALHFRANSYGVDSPLEGAAYPKASVFPYYLCTQGC